MSYKYLFSLDKNKNKQELSKIFNDLIVELLEIVELHYDEQGNPTHFSFKNNPEVRYELDFE